MLRQPHHPTHDFQERLLRGEVVHIADLTDPEFSSDEPIYRTAVDLGDARTLLMVPLRKDGALLGYLTASRKEVRPFTDQQIALLQNFAAQAVIAMENARLLTETREALEQQTATAEVLQVINSSPGELAPVFDAILEKAHSLCGAEHGALATYDGEYFRAVALNAMPEPFGELLRQPFRTSAAGSAQRRLLQGERLIHIPDVTAVDPVTPIQHASIEAEIRTLLMVPLHKDDRLLGYITANRREVRPFSDKQIALLQNFAAQAVIAMENARLITETREALEQQTATAEVLQVINSSPGDLAPVFDAMIDKAMRLCDAAFGVLWTYDGEYMHASAIRGVPPQMVEFLRHGPHRPARVVQQGLLGGEPFQHIPDLTLADGYRSGDPLPRAGADLGGVRTLLGVPLRKDDKVLGVFGVYRQEVRPVYRQADRAAAELRGAGGHRDGKRAADHRDARGIGAADRDRRGIAGHQFSSPGDLTPVFDAMLEKAHPALRGDLRSHVYL